MRLIACSLSEQQVRDEIKDITRRLGWLDVKVGEHLMFCRKIMGRKPGEPLVRIREIEVVSVRREKLSAMTENLNYGFSECKREGFANYTPKQFVAFFCHSHKGCKPSTIITRISALTMACATMGS